MYIQNRRNSSKFKGCNPLQLLNGLMSLKPATAHICIYQSVTAKCKKRHSRQFAT